MDAHEMAAAATVLADEVERINALGGTLPSDAVDEGPGNAGWPSEEAVLAAALVKRAGERSC